MAETARELMTDDLEGVRNRYFTLAESIREQTLPIEVITQTIRPRQSTLNSRVKLKRLLDSAPGAWKFGERIGVYEHESGGYEFAENYRKDANAVALLDRLKDVIERFRGALESDAVFDAAFPRISPTTDMEAARNQKPVQQLGLF